MVRRFEHLLLATLLAGASGPFIPVAVAQNIAPLPSVADGAATLEALAHEASNAHPAVLSRRARLRGAQARKQAAQMELLPSLSANVEDSATGTLSSGYNSQAILSLTQPLWTGGRYGADKRVARGEVESSEAEVAEVRRQVALAVADAWGSLLSAWERRTVLDEGLKRLTVLKDRIDRRAEGGFSPAADQRLVGARIDQLAATISQTEGDIKASTARLAELLGRPVDPARLARVDNAQFASRQDMDKLMDAAMTSSPTLRRMKAQERIATGQVDQVRASAMPQLYARVEHERRLDNFLSGGANDTRLVAGFRFGVDGGWSIIPRVSSAKASEQAARDDTETTRRDISSTVSTQAAGLDATLAQLTAQERNVERISGVAESYERGFQAGTRSWLDLLNIVREETDARRSLAELKVQAAILNFRLDVYGGRFSWLD